MRKLRKNCFQIQIPVQAAARLRAADALTVDEEEVLVAADGGLHAEGDEFQSKGSSINNICNIFKIQEPKPNGGACA